MSLIQCLAGLVLIDIHCCMAVYASLNNYHISLLFSPPENDSFRKDLCFTHDVFFISPPVSDACGTGF